MAGVKGLSLEERFWTKVDKSGGCWTWTAALQKNGYGRFRMPDGHVGAHVMSYRLEIGEIPIGMEIHHKCYNRSCVKPEHLEAITHHQNLLDGDTLAGVNSRKKRCPQGHDYTQGRDGKRYCNPCRNARRRKEVVPIGDIGEPLWRREFVPMPESEPVHEPSPEVQPATEPAVEPAEAPEKESVPA